MKRCGECVYFNWLLATIAESAGPDWEVKCRVISPLKEKVRASDCGCGLWEKERRDRK